MSNASTVHTGWISQVTPRTTLENLTILGSGSLIVLSGKGSIKEDKILISKQLIAEVLEAPHSAYQGVNGMMANARAPVILVQCRCQHPIDEGTVLKIQLYGSVSAQRTADATFTLGVPIPKDGHRPIWPGSEKLDGIRRPVHRLNWNSPVTTRGKAATMSWFCTYCAPGEVPSDGGPSFDSVEYNSFLED